MVLAATGSVSQTLVGVDLERMHQSESELALKPSELDQGLALARLLEMDDVHIWAREGC